MSKTKTVLDFAKEVKDILSKDPKVKKSFTSEIAFLEDRIFKWEQTWRVGLIGITSAGKSTILNALLGADILPARVGATSNCLIRCQKGKEFSCEIIYTTRERQVFRGNKRQLASKIKLLADERNNIRNQKGILEIIIKDPEFLLPSNVAIVDSPGLDAFGHEDHEKVTLEQLIPTVDMVLYVTSTKASSDERLGFYLDFIRNKDKPVLLLQNKIDSIRPKLGNYGTILKSREEVLLEHKKRLEKAIRSTGGQELVQQVPIFQVSAKDALLGDRRASNMDNFIRGVQHCIGELEPKFNIGRYQQLYVELSKIIQREEHLLRKKPIESKKFFQERRQEFTQLNRIILMNSNDIEQKFNAHFQRMNNNKNKLQDRINNLGRKDFDKADEIARELQSWYKDIAQVCTDIIVSSRKQMQSKAKRLNLREEDFMVRLTGSPVGSGKVSIRKETKSETYEKKVKKKGVWAGVVRFFGGSGGYRWETRTRTWEEIDISTFRQEASNVLTRGISWLRGKTEDLTASFKEQSDVFYREIEMKLRGIEEREKNALEATQKKVIVDDLKQYQRHMEQFKPKKITTLDKKQEVIQESKYENLALKDAEYQQVEEFLKVVDKLDNYRTKIFKEQFFNPKILKQIIIWGWSNESLVELFNIFFPEVEVSSEQFSRKQMPNFQEVEPRSYIVNLQEKDRVDVDQLKFLLRERFAHIIIVNAAQIGVTKSQFARSPIQIIPKSHKKIFVLQGFDECLSGQQMGEMIAEFASFVEGFVNVDGWIALHPNFNYSLLLDYLRDEPLAYQTHQGEMETLGLFCSPKAETIGSIISRDWLVDLLREVKAQRRRH